MISDYLFLKAKIDRIELFQWGSSFMNNVKSIKDGYIHKNTVQDQKNDHSSLLCEKDNIYYPFR